MLLIVALSCSVLLCLDPGARVLSPKRGVPLQPFCPPPAPVFQLFPPDEVGPFGSCQPGRGTTGRCGRVGLPAGVCRRVDQGRRVPQCGGGSAEVMGGLRGDEGRWSAKAGIKLFAARILLD